AKISTVNDDSKPCKTILQPADAAGCKRLSLDLAGAGPHVHHQPGLVLEVRAGVAAPIRHQPAVGKFFRGPAGAGRRVVWRRAFYFAAGPGPAPRGAAAGERRFEGTLGAEGGRGRNRPTRGKVRRDGGGVAAAPDGARRSRPETPQPRDAADRRLRR